jgi:predicted DNA binding protein
MQKKSSKKGSKKPISATLRARALAIINSDEYDVDTRASIKFQLKTNYDELADSVRSAEHGVTICDAFMSEAKQRQGIRAVVKLLGSDRGILPLWFLQAINSALVAMAQEKGIDTVFVNSPDGLWDGIHPDAENRITELFKASGGRERKFAFTPVLTDKQRVIDALDELLTSPQTPEDLYGHVADFVVEAVNDRGRHNSLIYDKPVLAVVIDTYSGDELRGAFLASEAARKAKEAQDA